ncbi:MAG: TonB-dependent receptor [Gammaproteobacteria bacterium]|nr:TonB-dependent receptor [Gammaproteobacteria bacterium]MBT5154895.1 TonB-dependent receptor [Gammaproteobacteria bacterium]MBT5685104.1 TonB-dependent receptor [Gammaproteobacteria bacterium]MBT6582821.1 TonB-dependent receptor [Gammaproteobacteria bacterium]
MITREPKLITRLSLTLALICMSLPSWSQIIEEVVVISSKQAAGISTQDLPASVVTFNEASLKQAFTVDLVDVGKMVANAELNNVGTYASYPNFFIRGMGVNGSTRTNDPKVGVFVDGIYVGYNAGALSSTFDLEAVEVLRGPQGTLLGRNVTGGAVLVRSKRPGDEFGFNVEAGAGDYGSTEFNASIEGPLSSNVFGKLAVIKMDRDGYFEDNNRGSIDLNIYPAGMPDTDTGDKVGMDLTIIRPMVRFDFSENFEATLIAEFLKNDAGSANSQNVAHNCAPIPGVDNREIVCGEGSRFLAQTRWGYTPPSDKYEINHDLIGYTELETNSLVLDATWDLSHGVVTAIVGYRDVEYNSSTDFDGTPFTIFHFNDNKEEQEQTSIEVRYSSTFSDRVNFVVGVNSFEQEYSIGERRNFFIALNAATYSETEHETFGVFGEANFAVTEALSLTLGGRWTKEEKSIDIGVLGSCELDFSSCSNNTSNKKDWTDFSPKVAATYSFNDDMMAYASWTRGFASGVFNARAATIDAVGPTDPEKVDSVEVGFKTSFLDGRGLFNITYFQADYEDLILFVNNPCDDCGASLINFNAGEAEISGFEVEVQLQPIDGLRLDASVGTVDPEFTNIKFFDANADGTVDGEDNKLASRWDFQKVAELSYSLAASYEFDAMGGSILGRVAYSWRDDYMTDLYNKPWLQQESFGLLDASLTFNTANEKIRLSVYGKNLTDEEYFDYAADVGTLDSARWGGTPRTYGVRVAYKY